MKTLFIIASVILFASCKKEYTCNCKVNRDYYFNGTYSNSEQYNESNSLGKVSKSLANQLCYDNVRTINEGSWEVVDSYKCVLK